ncbi:hypothetical protein V8C34DRAFT_184034 [Trichoderma compactum]
MTLYLPCMCLAASTCLALRFRHDTSTNLVIVMLLHPTWPSPGGKLKIRIRWVDVMASRAMHAHIVQARRLKKERLFYEWASRIALWLSSPPLSLFFFF